MAIDANCARSRTCIGVGDKCQLVSLLQLRIVVQKVHRDLSDCLIGKFSVNLGQKIENASFFSNLCNTNFRQRAVSNNVLLQDGHAPHKVILDQGNRGKRNVQLHESVVIAEIRALTLVSPSHEVFIRGVERNEITPARASCLHCHGSFRRFSVIG